MHQHPRPAAPTSFPSVPGPARGDDQGQSLESESQPPDGRTINTRGSGIETGTESVDHAQRNAAPPREAVANFNQIISVSAI